MKSEHELVKWLFQNGCFKRKSQSDSRTATHVAYDGGTLAVPDHLMDKFWDLYRDAIQSGEDLFLCECITPVCKMFCDLDVLEELGADKDFPLEEVLKIMNEIVEYYFHKSFSIIVCKTPLKEVTKNQVKYRKTGIHLYWTDLYLEPEMCHALSKQFVKEIEKRLGNRPETVNPWSDVVDDKVYKRSLRMIYSKKMDKKKARSQVYEPVMIYPEVETQTIEELDWKLCTLQTYNGETAITPINPIPEVKVSKKERARLTEVSDELQLMVEKAINNEPYWDYQIHNFLQRKVGGKIKDYVVSLRDCHFCINKGTDHDSEHVYFIIKQDGFYQRCHCKCDKVRRTGKMCSDFESKRFDLPQALLKKLFPNAKKLRRKKKGLDPMKPQSFGSNILLKNRESQQDFLQMSWNTILEIEKEINELSKIVV